MYRLKQGVEGFTVMGGPMEGRSFKKGKLYGEIPPEEAGKFDQINDAAQADADSQEAAAGAHPENSEV